MNAAEEIFELWFAPPPHRTAYAPREGATVMDLNGRTRHVLVLDDEPAIVEVLSEVLTDEGYRVTGIGTPPPVEEIARLAPDVIILDLVFGGQNAGLGFLAILRSHPATAATPVLVCTALTDPGVLSALTQVRPAVQVLTKPFDIDAVGTLVRCAAAPYSSGRPA